MMLLNKEHFAYYTPLIGLLLGVVGFIQILGTDILDPQNLNWLLQQDHSDSAQHLIGWEFFRHEPWQLPLGLIQSYGFPVPTSIVYTDSIPLIALLAKCFKSILPEHFQYFGLWLILCFALQGFFAWLLSKMIHPHLMIQIMITSFFVMSPIFLNRTIEHQALAAQWLLLAGLWLYLKPFHRGVFWLWMLLLITSLMIHAYLTAMIVVLECAYIYKAVRHESSIRWFEWIGFFNLQTVILGFEAWMIGYFVIQTSDAFGSSGYQVNAMNLLAPIRPTSGSMTLPNHWSFFLNTLFLPQLEQGDEGFNYLGLGMIGLVICASFYVKGAMTQRVWKVGAPLWCACVVLTLFALSNRIMLSSHVLFHYSLFPFLQEISHILRASGRFFWPVVDVFMVGTFWILSHQMKLKTLWITLGLALLIQCIDLSVKFKELHHYFAKKFITMPILPEQLIVEGGKKYKQLVILPFTKQPQVFIPHFQYYVHMAALKHMTVNLGYFARADYTALRKVSYQQLRLILQGYFEKETLYLITNPHLEHILKTRVMSTYQQQIISLKTIKPI